MTKELETTLYTVSHCIICDEMPSSKGNFKFQLDILEGEYNAKVTWKRCRLCKIQDTTMALIEVREPLR